MAGTVCARLVKRSAVARRAFDAASADAAHAASARMFGTASSLSTHTHAQTPDATLLLAMGFYLPYRSAHYVRRRHVARTRPAQGCLSAPHYTELPCPRVSVDIMAADAPHEPKPSRSYELLHFVDDRHARTRVGREADRISASAAAAASAAASAAMTGLMNSSPL